MQHLNLTKKWKLLVFFCGILIVILVLCIWLFGWGQGNINAIDFSAAEVERVQLSCAQLYAKGPAVICDPTEIQTLIDAINDFRDTGSDIKWLFKYGLFVGGSVLYEYTFYLTNGNIINVCFASNEGNQPLSDMELRYWISWPNGTKTKGSTCRGSLEEFYTLHKKYLPYE